MILPFISCDVFYVGMPSSPEKSMASRGKKRNGKSKSNLSRTSSKPTLSKIDSGPSVKEMIDVAIQTEVFVPEKTKEVVEAEAAMRKMSIVMVPESIVKELSDMDENTNWVSD